MKFNNSNYKVYLERMDKSAAISSKGLILKYVKGRALDVGCGSGVLLRQLDNAKGIDLNINAVEECIKQGLDAECISLFDLTEKFDTIIFSSVLHEFSSYADSGRFGKKPIEAALLQARNNLDYNGRIIIRDGVAGDTYPIIVTAKSIEVVEAFKKYIIDAPMWDKNVKVNIDNLKITAPFNILKEFMFTYTWGPESYPREVNEKFGILRPGSWVNLIESCGYKIDYIQYFPEEYEKYLSKYFEDDEVLNMIFKRSVVLIVATKI